jgi:hypothetical protein
MIACAWPLGSLSTNADALPLFVGSNRARAPLIGISLQWVQGREILVARILPRFSLERGAVW